MAETKTIEIGDVGIILTRRGPDQQWYGWVDINNASMEINFAYHIQPEIDWEHFRLFYEFITDGRLPELQKNGLPIITAIGEEFFALCLPEIAAWNMEAGDGIFYNGKLDGKGRFSYSLCYNYIVRSGDTIDGDAYGLYLVDFEDDEIVGAKRIQV